MTQPMTPPVPQSLLQALKVSIVIPTYQEVLNIPLVARALQAALIERYTFEIIFVDDHSEDGSVDAVAALKNKNIFARIEVRTQERGLSTAVIHGIKAAHGEYIVVMDADLSHPAETIPKMLEFLEAGTADFCVGSRYIAGGAMASDWGWLRQVNSKIATGLALPLCNIKDPMSGFFAFKRSQMPQAHLLSPLGYKIGLEILVKGSFKQPVEIPIHFQDRQYGTSKLGLNEQVQYLRHLRRLYTFKFPTASEFVQFGLVGATGFLIDSLCYFGLQQLGCSHTVARALAFWPAVTWNWFWNRTITFTASKKDRKARQWLAFVGVCLYGFVINVGSYKILTDYVPFFAEQKYLAMVIGVLLGMGFNFMAARILVFRALVKTVLEEDNTTEKA